MCKFHSHKCICSQTATYSALGATSARWLIFQDSVLVCHARIPATYVFEIADGGPAYSALGATTAGLAAVSAAAIGAAASLHWSAPGAKLQST